MGRQKTAETPVVDSAVVGDHPQTMDPGLVQGVDQFVRNTGETEATNSQGRTVQHVPDSSCGAGDDLIHRRMPTFAGVRRTPFGSSVAQVISSCAVCTVRSGSRSAAGSASYAMTAWSRPRSPRCHGPAPAERHRLPEQFGLLTQSAGGAAATHVGHFRRRPGGSLAHPRCCRAAAGTHRPREPFQFPALACEYSNMKRI